ncbi:MULTISPECIES: MdtA/MuxA family multidrug efflux RND transporter periplasmic adaptor subunit [Pseudomonas]|uniref:MdtA/MuxA family multidrug efflux RND transporter periplasmic adaptor subunit n=1 Tax=Pseudomonas taiwanensis TaxID=470150 RepID=A0ABR6VEL9_9PSED|nr:MULTISPECIES: MdtA/MuxA family multidrug efflux RND transporter periplasmic adaptor subunit [Pseudomonas]AGZ35082.1 RND family efflux transporter MFP subunit [Pseudomonas sp. VLB120]AVD90628.1 multidrug transporter subunit MdtA [Pseudomonas sp. SWI44]MBC3478606.1 MdtA/MuxA family multidrug efflux RND transporter periplasmic adaptor subunit [Pseudomonas taiwanensis]MBC3493492.1 MdtA/MuxA family multidrug efflux RND transporter periplasmic adaptor subunit [Pseudomonas taiwanensis]MDT8923678.1
MQASVSRSPRRWLVGLLILLLVALLAWWLWPATPAHKEAGGGRMGMGMGKGRPGFGASTDPVPVRVEPVRVGDFPLYYKALGTVTATNTVNVRSRVAGELVKIHFKEGQQVKAGDLLAEIDPRSYRIALQQAEGTLAQNQAQLKNAQVDLARYKGLYAEDSIAKQTLDTAEAQVAQFQGLVKTNQAQVNDARLNLDFTQIRAPISGRVGLRQLDLGNLVAANDTTALVVITQTEPISVTFTLPETELSRVLERYRSGASLPVEAWDRSDSKLQSTGVLGSLDNQIDTTTGTLKFKGRFENKDQALFPNQFVNVRLLADTLKQVVLAPAAAIQFGNDGTFAYVVNADNKVNIRKLKVGASDGEHSVILEGLAAGDRLVLEGTDRLREGTQVEVVEDSSQVPTTPGQHLQGQDAKGSAQAGEAGKAGA